jgi:hypothetical protein
MVISYPLLAELDELDTPSKRLMFADNTRWSIGPDNVTVLDPSAAKTNVIATRTLRFWNERARYAGSITEMQQGAKSARAPATTAAITDSPKKSPLSTVSCPSR